MANFDDHIKLAKENLSFLISINRSNPDKYDWQVTVAFYTALHFVNAHLAIYDLHYRSHNDTKESLNPFHISSVTKVPEDEYAAYVALYQLSLRSRYLVKEGTTGLQANASFVYDKHLAKALRHLDKIIYYFDKRYSLGINKFRINCSSLKLDSSLKLIQ